MWMKIFNLKHYLIMANWAVFVKVTVYIFDLLMIYDKKSTCESDYSSLHNVMCFFSPTLYDLPFKLRLRHGNK